MSYTASFGESLDLYFNIYFMFGSCFAEICTTCGYKLFLKYVDSKEKDSKESSSDNNNNKNTTFDHQSYQNKSQNTMLKESVLEESDSISELEFEKNYKN